MQIKYTNYQNEIYLIIILLSGLFLILISKPYYMFTVNDAYQNSDQAYHLFIGDGLYLKSNGVLMEPVQGPGYPIIIFLFFALFGVSDNVVMFTSIFFSILLIFLTFLLGKELFSPKEGLFASLILILSPLFLLQSVASQNDMTSVFFVTLAIFLCIRFVKTSKYLYFLFSMIALNFSFLAKYPDILIGVLILFIIVYNKKHIDMKKCIVIYIISSILIVVPFMVYNYNNHGNVLPYASQFYEERGEPYNAGYIVPHVTNIFSYIFINNDFFSNYIVNDDRREYLLWSNQLFPIFFTIGLMGLILTETRSNKMMFIIFALWFGIYIAFFSFFTLLELRYLLHILVPMSLIIAYSPTYLSTVINSYLNETPKKIKENVKITKYVYKYTMFIVIFILVLSSYFLLPNYINNAIRSRGEWSYIKEAGLFVKENTPNNSLLISLNSYALDFYSKREVIELDPEIHKMFYEENGIRKNISQLLDEKHPLYAVQVNTGYHSWGWKQDITRSHQAIINLSNSYGVVMVKEMPEFILYKIENKS